MRQTAMRIGCVAAWAVGLVFCGTIAPQGWAADSSSPELRITQERVCPGSISRFQYGQFIEYLCAHTLSSFAEKVSDGGFEGVPNYNVSFRPQTDRWEQPWYPEGAVHRGEFPLDPDRAFNGKVSQCLRVKPGEACTIGVSQEKMAIEAGKPLRCRLAVRGSEPSTPVSIALWGPGKDYAKATVTATPEWKVVEATLTPTASDPEATLTISFFGNGAVWLDQVSLMPTDNVAGWRRDIAEALKAVKPGIIRFGGSATEWLEWTSTIGDPTQRTPFTGNWGGMEPGNAGLDEFLQLCQWVEAEPLICVRFSGKTPQDAAEQVQYVNGPADSPMGKLRAANGHPEPYGVKYWQIGNELGDENYQRGVLAFGQAMKAVDPSIKLLSSYPSPGLLKNAGQVLDYISPHHYECHHLAEREAELPKLRAMIAENAPGRDIRLAVTEWNTTAGDWGLGRGMLWTLDNALWCSRYHNYMHRHCDQIEIANRSNWTDTFCCGIVQPNRLTYFKTPTYYAQQLYALHGGQYPLVVAGAAETVLDLSATLSEDGKRIALFVVNPSREAQPRTLNLTAFAPLAKEVRTWTLTDHAKALDREVANSWREPERVAVEEGAAKLVQEKVGYEFSPLSLTVVEMRK